MKVTNPESLGGDAEVLVSDLDGSWRLQRHAVALPHALVADPVLRDVSRVLQGRPPRQDHLPSGPIQNRAQIPHRTWNCENPVQCEKQKKRMPQDTIHRSSQINARLRFTLKVLVCSRSTLRVFFFQFVNVFSNNSLGL